MKHLVCAAALAVVAISSAHAECLVESKKLEPYYVLGTLVQPQSDILAVGECGKTYEELNKAYTAAVKESADEEAARSLYSKPNPSYGIHCESHLSANGSGSTLDANCR